MSATSQPLTAAPVSAARMHLVIGGHVDHGKSTIIGRLLADTGSLPEGKLEEVRERCARTSRPFEYAFLLDALKDEQSQGITIDAARVFFKTAVRDYIILDAPGHIEFLKNMITGAARAEAALLVIDAAEGVQENSRRHGYMMSLLGIRQLAVLVNKMDLVGYDANRFQSVVDEFSAFLGRFGVAPSYFVPVAGREGDNIATRSAAMPWYHGPTVLEVLDRFVPEPSLARKPFRMPVQDVYKFTAQGDDRRIVAGTVETGSLAAGDQIVFYPSGKQAKVRTLEAFNRETPARVEAGESAGFTLTEQIYVGRGELAVRAGELPPAVTTRLRVNLFWLGREPFTLRKEVTLKIGSAKVPARLEEILRVIDASTLAGNGQHDSIKRHEVAECVLRLGRAIAVDRAEDLAATGRFVVVDDYEIRGGGLVQEALEDEQAQIREKVLLRNAKWEPSSIPAERRAERYGQRAAVVLITGAPESDRKGLARDLEARLFDEGRIVYFLGIANILYGVDADIGRKDENRTEHLRRLAEVANILLDAGAILLVTASELTQDDLALIRTSIDPDRIETVWVGDRRSTDLSADLVVGDEEPAGDRVERIKRRLQEKGVLFRPW
jgi:bifunctional enzyme CysN/CysC